MLGGASRAVSAMREMPTIVTSSPSRRIAAWPKSTMWSLVVGHLAALAVEVLVLDEDDRVVVADRRLEQPLGVGRRCDGTATSRPGTCR